MPGIEIDLAKILLFYAEALGGARSVAPGEGRAGFGETTNRDMKLEICAKNVASAFMAAQGRGSGEPRYKALGRKERQKVTGTK